MTQRDWSRGACRAAIQRAAEQLSHPPGRFEYDKLDIIPQRRAIERHYDTWEDALRDAGFEDDEIRPPEHVYARSEFEDAIRTVAARTDALLSLDRYERLRDDDHPHGETVAKRFGSFPEFRDEVLKE